MRTLGFANGPPQGGKIFARAHGKMFGQPRERVIGSCAARERDGAQAVVTDVSRARALRWNMTEAERKLWAALRRRQILGRRFRRQQPIGPFVADFFCAEAKLIIEVDGSQHGEELHALDDKRRSVWLEDKGYRILRFWNGDVLARRAEVIDAIERVLLARDAD